MTQWQALDASIALGLRVFEAAAWAVESSKKTAQCICFTSLSSSCWAEFWEAEICSERDHLGSCKPYWWLKGCKMSWNMEVNLLSLSWTSLEICPFGGNPFPFGIFSRSCREVAVFGILQQSSKLGMSGLQIACCFCRRAVWSFRPH